eukprot:gb/GECG01011329.1/.p1 GENE.gb/GECG01011329.1/~~gb/GECG01011329.1/.p1  ORF type:complete len:291 (+),score=49.44 gb/GECG01011329.1/:1-873(+)
MKVYKSEIPSSCQNGQAVCLGIDEAGRGPVLGPMVYGAAYWPLEREKEMEDSSFDDSKALSPEQRKSLFENIKNHPHVGYIILEIPPEEISSKMLRKIPYNLNAISHDTAIGLVEKALEDNVQVEKVYVDTVGDPSRYEKKLDEYFGGKIEFTVRKKADSLYKCVSAASICAKVTRDEAMEHWDKEHSIETKQGAAPYGSGYPSDPSTKEWLRQNVDAVFGFPSIVRFSWSTSRDLLADQAAACEWTFNNDENSGSKISSFLGNSNCAYTKKHKKSGFLKRRKLNIVQEM